jgi:hypothetical protein
MIDVDDLVSRECNATFGRFFTAVARCGLEDQLKKCLNRGQTSEGSNNSIRTRTLNSALRFAAEEGLCSGRRALQHFQVTPGPWSKRRGSSSSRVSYTERHQIQSIRDIQIDVRQVDLY